MLQIEHLIEKRVVRMYVSCEQETIVPEEGDLIVDESFSLIGGAERTIS
jgi:hypothetical protein